MLEVVGQGKEKMSDTVFLRLIGEHEARIANNDNRGNAKAMKSTVHKQDETRESKPACWCCGAGRRATMRTDAL